MIKDGFAVQPKYPDKEIIPPVNEYSTSWTNCVIFTTSVTINLLNLHINDDDDSDVETEQPGLPTNAPQTTHVFTEAFEVKSHGIDKPAIAEVHSFIDHVITAWYFENVKDIVPSKLVFDIIVYSHC